MTPLDTTVSFLPLAIVLTFGSCGTVSEASFHRAAPVLVQFRLEGKQFGIGKFEVTNREFQAFVEETGYDGGDHPSSKPTEPFLSHFHGGKCPPELANHPVCNVNWWHAKAYCSWLATKLGRQVRLPTAAEWRYVAAGTTGRKYPWGSEWDGSLCNWGTPGDGFAKSAPVGSFPRGCTPEGVHDLAGNIWEWCEDQTLRGGPWCMGPETVTTDFEGKEDAERADDKFGFRIVVL